MEHSRLATAVLLASLLAGPLIDPASGQVLTTRASVATGGGQSSLASSEPAISADGRFVAFASQFAFDPGDTNGTTDVYLRDRQTGATLLVSYGPGGLSGDGVSGAPALSASGRFVAFHSRATNFLVNDANLSMTDVFVRDMLTGTLTLASVDSFGVQSNGFSTSPSISADGRLVVFSSGASNLSAQADANGVDDIFLRDTLLLTTERVSVSSTGVEGNGGAAGGVISADGSTVVFNSSASNLVSGDTNGFGDIFRRVLATGSTTLISWDRDGNPSNGSSHTPDVSGDGTRVVFSSFATDLVPEDTNGWRDVFAHSVTAGLTRGLSVGLSGLDGNGPSELPSISHDGSRVAYKSSASNLVPGDTNGAADAFLFVLSASTLERVSIDSHGAQASDTDWPVLDGDGTRVAYGVEGLWTGDTNGVGDVYVSDTEVGGRSYCTAGTSASGCQAALSASGLPSRSLASGFQITATGVEGSKDGIFFFGTNGRQANPWWNGTSLQCVVPPVKRTGLQSGSGTPAACDGASSLDLNAWMAAHPVEAPEVGILVQAQFWYRDPQSTSNQTTALSDALELTVAP